MGNSLGAFRAIVVYFKKRTRHKPYAFCQFDATCKTNASRGFRLKASVMSCGRVTSICHPLHTCRGAFASCRMRFVCWCKAGTQVRRTNQKSRTFGKWRNRCTSFFQIEKRKTYYVWVFGLRNSKYIYIDIYRYCALETLHAPYFAQFIIVYFGPTFQPIVCYQRLAHVR